MRDQTNVRVGQAIKAARARARRTQNDLARLAGISVTTLARYEIGVQPTPLRRLQQLAELLKADELSTLAAELATARFASFAPRTRTDASSPRAVLFEQSITAFDWWTKRTESLRQHEKLHPSRIMALESELAGIVANMLARSNTELESIPDKALKDCLEALLQVQLRFERLAGQATGRTAA